MAGAVPMKRTVTSGTRARRASSAFRKALTRRAVRDCALSVAALALVHPARLELPLLDPQVAR